MLDVGDVRGSVALIILLVRILSVLFKDIFVKITPICAASWAFACICSRGAKSAGLEPLALSMPVAGLEPLALSMPEAETSLPMRTELGPLSPPLSVSTVFA